MSIERSGAKLVSTSSTVNQKQCFHCQEALTKFNTVYASLGDQKQVFCCHGCAAVASYIHQSDLDDFYQRRQLDRQADFHRARVSDRAVKQEWAYLDDPATAGEYVRTLGNGDRIIRVKVSGLYCSSCGWLISQSLQKLSPDIRVNVDASARLIYLRFTNTKTKISPALQEIARLGYKPAPVAVGAPQASNAEQQKLARRESLKRIAVAGFGMMQVMTYAVALYFGDYQGMKSEYHRFFNLISMLVATLVVFYSGKPFFQNAWQDLKNRHLGMDVPIALAIAGAYIPSVYQTLFRDAGHVYFDSAVMFIFFLSVGRYIEMRARHRLAPAPTALNSLLPDYIKIQRESAAKSISVRPQDVLIGDIIQLESSQIVPFDGVINTGQAQVDESFISGESLPVSREENEVLQAGSLIVHGNVQLQANKTWQQSSIANIESLLEQANTRGAQQHASTQQAAQYFILSIMLITALTGFVWWFIAPERVFQIVLAMLVASCPCAFSLAAPLAATAASHCLRQQGMLLANFEALQVLPKISSWCFDKTGTLTAGRPKVVDVELHGRQAEDRCIAIAAALEADNQHVLSSAFNSLPTSLVADSVNHHPGKGISGEIEGKTYYLGKSDWVQKNIDVEFQATANSESKQDKTRVILASENEYLATFYIHDEFRPEASAALGFLKHLQKQLAILSGDRLAVVKPLAQQFDIKRYYADQSAAQKLQQVHLMQQNGEVVAMVGDGVNDAPVLAQADLSVAMAQGSELSHSQADIVVMINRLDSIEQLYSVTAKTRTITNQNKSWALVYNLVALPLAAAGLLNPWLAALGMSISSLLVVLNAGRIVSAKN